MKFYLGVIDGKRTLFPWEKDIPKGVKAPELDIPTDKTGLMTAIQELLTEADEARLKLNTQIDQEVTQQLNEIAPAILNVAVERSKQAEPTEDYTKWSVAIDDAWDKLPLARKLHFAALAMEDARNKL